MGQQQLLLVILVTIIVGIATAVAITTFQSASDNANLDAVRNDVAQIAAGAQGYLMKPAMLGGGGNAFTGITFNDFAFAADKLGGTPAGTSALNINGVYVLTVSDTLLTITAHPASRLPGGFGIDENGNLSATADNPLEAQVTPNNVDFTDPN